LDIRKFNLWKSKFKSREKIGLNQSLIHIHFFLPLKPQIFLSLFSSVAKKFSYWKKNVDVITPSQPQVTPISLWKFLLEFNKNIYSATVGLVVLLTHIHKILASPTGNIDYFLNNPEEALNHIADIIFCEDFNINYLSDNRDKQALNSLLKSYSLLTFCWPCISEYFSQ